MPTIAASVVPPPKSWDEFEEITLSAVKLRWDSTDFYRNGRPGQQQDGVDIWGHDEKRMIGVQCKNTIEGVSKAVVDAEVASAEGFEPKLDHLYVATTAKRDGPLQKAVRDLSRERKMAGRFRVDLLFWDDVCGDLAIDDDVFFKHYPQLKQKTDPAREHDKRLFDQLTALLRSDGVIGFLDRTNMAGFSFRDDALNPLREFYYEWGQPEREFIAPELEKIRGELWAKVDAYHDLLAENLFPAKRPNYSTVPPEWEYEDPERFWRVVQGIHSLAHEIVELHANLIRTGRALLIGSEYA